MIEEEGAEQPKLGKMEMQNLYPLLYSSTAVMLFEEQQRKLKEEKGVLNRNDWRYNHAYVCF